MTSKEVQELIEDLRSSRIGAIYPTLGRYIAEAADALEHLAGEVECKACHSTGSIGIPETIKLPDGIRYPVTEHIRCDMCGGTGLKYNLDKGS
jgi:hypothetical protein